MLQLNDIKFPAEVYKEILSRNIDEYNNSSLIENSSLANSELVNLNSRDTEEAEEITAL